jgi:hypothetical protein
MQEHDYPARHEPLIFSTMMPGILDDDAIEVRMLHCLYHTAIRIDVHDLDKAARRTTRTACNTRIARISSCVLRPLSMHLPNGP